MKNKFTFKKEPKPTGLFAVGNPNSDTIIKLQKRQVGYIAGPNWHTEDRKWQIRLMIAVEDNFKWMNVKTRFDTEPEAREWIKINSDKISALNLYFMDDD